jgi:dTDP-glucose pyrophosphorylase/predicted transcriptional regulator
MTVQQEDTLLHALRVLENSQIAIAFVCDTEQVLVGTLTDGDVRRALLAGASLHETPVSAAMSAQFLSVAPRAARAEVLDMMRARAISQIPIVDERGHLIGVHTLQELIGPPVRTNTAVVMAGGLGTRMRPLTDQIPKPMIRVAGRPILERLVLHLVASGIRKIFLSVNYLADLVEKHFGDGSSFGCEIGYLRETTPLGTGGALSLLQPRPEDAILVMNGDLVTQADVGGLLDFHTAHGYAATMGVRVYRVGIPYGVAVVQDGRLLGLREKPTEEVVVNAGVYALAPFILDMVPAGQEFMITDLFHRCLERALPLGAHMNEGDWIDIGRPEELLRANGKL